MGLRPDGLRLAAPRARQLDLRANLLGLRVRADGKSYYFGFISYAAPGPQWSGFGTAAITTLQILNPMSTPYLPATVDDANANPLAETIYYGGSTLNHYDAGWNLLDSTTTYGWSRVVLKKIDDPVFGAPYVALKVFAYAGPSSTGPWTIQEAIILTRNHVGSDTANCGSAAYSYKGLYQWSVPSQTIIRSYGAGWQYHP